MQTIIPGQAYSREDEARFREALRQALGLIERELVALRERVEALEP